MAGFRTPSGRELPMLNPEHMLVPYQLAELPAAPWLVFAPHADDETFGMAGSLLRAREAGLETHVIVVTDGSLGGEAADLVAIRQQEARRAADLLGLRSLSFWSEPDRGLVCNEALIARSAAAIADVAAVSVFFPAPLELHPDHRTTAQLVWAALQRLAGGPRAAAAFAYEISVQSPVNRLLDISDQVRAKQEVMAVYASQNEQNAYPNLVTALNRARTFTLPDEVQYAEAFCHYPAEALGKSLREATTELLDLYW